MNNLEAKIGLVKKNYIKLFENCLIKAMSEDFGLRQSVNRNGTFIKTDSDPT